MTRAVELHSGAISDCENGNDNDINDALDIDSLVGECSNNNCKPEPAHLKTTSQAAVKYRYDPGVPVEPHIPRAVKWESSGGPTEFLAAKILFLKNAEKATQDQLEFQRRREDCADMKHQRQMERARYAELRKEQREKVASAEKRFKNAQEILKMEGLDSAVKAAAQKVVLDYLSMEF